MTPSTRECELLRRLWIEEALGRALGKGESALRDRHLAGCAPCRAESEAMRRLGDPEAPGPAPALDDLTRRRWIDRALGRSELALAEEALEKRSPSARRAAVAGIAAAALLAVAASVWLSRGGQGPGTARPAAAATAASAPSAPKAIGAILMASGELSASPAGAEGERELAAGGVLETRDGIAVAAMEGGISLRLERETAVELVESGPTAAAVRLGRGELLVAVDPNRKGRAFRVLVGDAAVEVKGTIFSVSRAGDGGASVSVFRGEVVVSAPGGARSVHIGETIAIGDLAVRPLGDDATLAVEAAMDSLSALSPSEAAFLEVESLPRGATVSVDGIAIGRTPLTASLRPGYRRLELGLEGREPVRELLRLAEGAKTSRTFDLSGAAKASRAPAANDDPTGPRAAKALSPGELLEAARSRRASGDFSGAIAAYERLIVEHPDAPVARAALVSLGQLYLDQGGNPGRGLQMFRRYLSSARRGALAQEAAFGVAAAHRALGDTAGERAALEAFLRDFGGSNQAQRAEARLAELR